MFTRSEKSHIGFFTREVYYGSEQDHSDNARRRLAHLFPAHPQFAFVDELVSLTVRWNPEERIQTLMGLHSRVERIAERIEAGVRVLNLEIPQRCPYCAEGFYRPASDVVPTHQFTSRGKLPAIVQRRNPDSTLSHGVPTRLGVYGDLEELASPIIGVAKNRMAVPFFSSVIAAGMFSISVWT